MQRRTRPRHALLLTVLIGGGLLSLTIPAGAEHEERQAEGGLVELGFHDLGGTGFNTDVWGWTDGDRAYAVSGTWGTIPVLEADPGQSCPSQDDNPQDPQKSGVKIVDVTDPTAPQMVARLGSVPGSQNLDLKVLDVDAPDFTGTLLAVSIEPCGAEGLAQQLVGAGPLADVPLEQTGFQLYDVSDPADPVALGTYNNGGIGTHNLYLFARPDLDKVFVAAVWSEVDQVGAFNEDLIRSELQVVDVTDPSAPELVSTWALEDGPDQTDAEGEPTDGIPCDDERGDIAFCNLHDVWVSEDGRTAYASWWDAGLILLDLTDPADPQFIGNAQEQIQLPDDPEGWLNEEGNTHAAVPYQHGDRTLAIVTDEDFLGGASARPLFTVDSPSPLAGDRTFAQWEGTPELDPAVSGELAWVGTGTTPLAYAAAGDVAGKIAISSCDHPNGPQDVCSPATFFQMANLAAEAGAIGLVNVDVDDELPSATAVDAPIPAGSTTNSEGVPVIEAVIDGQTVTATMHLDPEVDPWGFLRVVDVTDPDPANWREVAVFKADHTEDPDPGPEDVFSVHNPIVGADGRIYVSWYTEGVFVLEPDGDSGAFRQAARFAPLPADHAQDLEEDPHGAHEDHFGFWGSFPLEHPTTGELLILNSDLNRGLYVLGFEEPAPEPPAPEPEPDPAPVPLPATGGGLAVLGIAVLLGVALLLRRD